jgi:Carboxypeptidase regulatory-like domain
MEFTMFTKSLRIGLIGFVLCAATAWAGLIRGVVKDAKGQAIKGADVRIESRDGKKVFKTVKTDGSGRYVSDSLAPGVYRVSLIVNGAVKASIMNTQTHPDQPTQLNFDLKPVSQASRVAKKGKHMVWVPSQTGSHIGGRWVEVDDNDTADTGALNVKKGSAEDLHRAQMQNSGGAQSISGTSTATGR